MSTLIEIKNRLKVNKTALGPYYYLFVFMMANGTRIQETLNIQVHEISATGSVLINMGKGSGSRVFYTEECAEYFIKCKERLRPPWIGIDRFKAYRMAKRFGIMIQKPGRQNLSVTHAFREIKARDARSLTQDDKTIANTLNQKSQRSAPYYGHTQKRRS